LSSLKERHSRRKLGHSLLRSKLHIKHQITTPDASTTARSDQDQAQILKRHRKDFNIFNCASTIKIHKSTSKYNGRFAAIGSLFPAFHRPRRGKVGLDEINGQGNRSHGDDQPEVACRPRTKKTTTSPLTTPCPALSPFLSESHGSSHQVIKSSNTVTA